MNPCKHLDHSDVYAQSCELVTIENSQCANGEPARYWKRKAVPYEGAPVNVQFCGLGRGRINGIFQCYNPGEMPCYEAPTTEAK